MIIRKTFSRLLLMILGACGLAGCDSIFDPRPMPEYAAPYADFKISGSVVDESSAAAIEGIEITFQGIKASADESGDWLITGRGGPYSSLFFIVANDIDGEENGGVFAPDTVRLDLTKTKKGSGWYSGTYEQHDIEIKMRKAP